MRHLRASIATAALLLAIATTSAIAPSVVPITRVAAASPSPSVGAGDTRTSGEAPGFVGAPLLAILAVLVLGTTAVLVTIAYVRLTGGPGGDADGAAQRG